MLGTLMDEFDPSNAYWHAPFTLPDGTQINATREGNSIRNSQRAVLLETLLRRAAGTLGGKSVLDVACAEGYFSHVALKLGAQTVLGVDCNEDEIRKADWIRRELGLYDLEFRVGDITEIDLVEFDVVFCLGILYHVEHPLLLMRKLATLTRQILVIDSDILPLPGPLARLEMEVGLPWLKDRTLSWVPSYETLLTMASACGFSGMTDVVLPSDAPIDYRCRRRIMVAFHKHASGSGVKSLPTGWCRPIDDRTSAPFTSWYSLGSIAYSLIGGLMRTLSVFTKRW